MGWEGKGGVLGGGGGGRGEASRSCSFYNRCLLNWPSVGGDRCRDTASNETSCRFQCAANDSVTQRTCRRRAKILIKRGVNHCEFATVKNIIEKLPSGARLNVTLRGVFQIHLRALLVIDSEKVGLELCMIIKTFSITSHKQLTRTAD